MSATSDFHINCALITGMAMVPLADLFNHKAAVVQLGGGYTVEDVCFEDMSASDQDQNSLGSDSEEADQEGLDPEAGEAASDEQSDDGSVAIQVCFALQLCMAPRQSLLSASTC